MEISDKEILLLGIVGSTAYGLGTPESDVDRLGIFAAPTSAFHGLRVPKESHVQVEPTDITLHEAVKWCRLALGCNPTVIELVWLPDDLIEVTSTWGIELRNIRSCFPTAEGVRRSYLGYATQQFKRLAQRGDGSFSADTRKRTAKHARHLFRLCHQGLQFYITGRLPIRLENPAMFRAFGDRVAEGDVELARKMLHDYELQFDRAKTGLLDRPDEERIERWLHAVRHAYWREPNDLSALRHHYATHHARLLARRSRESGAEDLSGDVSPGW